MIEADSRPNVALLVLNFNGKHFLKDCLENLLRTDWPNTIYLVDNGSNDGSLKFVSEKYPEIKIISFSQNLGFSEAYNRAVDQVTEDFVLFLNNDIKIEDPSWLTAMMELFTSNEKTGAVGVKTVSMTNQDVIDSVGGNIWRWIGVGTRMGGNETDSGQYDNPPVVPFYVVGVALLTKKTFFSTVGGFDSEMFAYSEDLDLSWKLRLRGYTILYCPNAVVKHCLSGSWGPMHHKKHYFCCRNFLRSSIKNYAPSSMFKELPPYLLVSFNVGLLLSISRKNSRYILSNIKSVFWNLHHLKNTLIERFTIQHSRKIDDTAIIRAMGPPLGTVTEMFKKKDFQ